MKQFKNVLPKDQQEAQELVNAMKVCINQIDSPRKDQQQRSQWEARYQGLRGHLMILFNKNLKEDKPYAVEAGF